MTVIQAGVIGQRFGRWTVIELGRSLTGRKLLYRCRCDCGVTRNVNPPDLRSGASSSCGCYRKEYIIAHNKAAGKSHTRAYNIYRNMVRRCSDPRNKDYSYYGGRGIAVCDNWLSSFESFFCDMGEPLPGMTLERTDNSGPYSKENCRNARPSAGQSEDSRDARNMSTQAHLVDLLPCPFCGNPAELSIRNSNALVKCMKCSCQKYIALSRDEAEKIVSQVAAERVVVYWNKRA